MTKEIPDPETPAFKRFSPDEVDPTSPPWLKGADGYAGISDGMPEDYADLERATYYDGHETGDTERRLEFRVSPE